MTADSVLMVSPAEFYYNEETAETNAFQHHSGLSEAEVFARASAEHEGIVERLRSVGVGIELFTALPQQHSPDAVFPNNWLATTPYGHVVVFPMLNPSRQREVRHDIVERVIQVTHFTREIDLRHDAHQGEALEGTGSIVFDHNARLAYAALGPRTSERLLRLLCGQIGYEPVTFHAIGAGGKEVYHTNVMLALGEGWAVVCPEVVDDYAPLRDRLCGGGRDVIEISEEQMGSFCGNVLALRDCIVMSETARSAFTPGQIRRLEAHARVLAVPCETIETVGGGGVRCTIAELFRRS